MTEVTALHEAARYGWRQLMTLLLLKGASCTIKAKDGATPKDYGSAHRARLVECVCLLLGRRLFRANPPLLW